MFIVWSTSIVNASNHTECISLSNQECKFQSTHINSDDNEYNLNIDFSFFYTAHLHKHNTKTKSLLNKYTTEPYLIYGNQIGDTKKVKKIHIYIYIYVYINSAYNLF